MDMKSVVVNGIDFEKVSPEDDKGCMNCKFFDDAEGCSHALVFEDSCFGPKSEQTGWICQKCEDVRCIVEFKENRPSSKPVSCTMVDSRESYDIICDWKPMNGDVLMTERDFKCETQLYTCHRCEGIRCVHKIYGKLKGDGGVRADKKCAWYGLAEKYCKGD